MTKHIILAQSKVTAKALQTFVRWARPAYYNQDDLEQETEEIVWEGEVDGIDAYRVAAEEIEARVAGVDGAIPVGQVVLLVDQVNLAWLNPTASVGWDSMVALLILTIPEIRWIFGVIHGVESEESKRLAKEHCLAALNANRIDPIFDPTGLREWVREQARTAGAKRGEESAAYLPVRSELAVAIDDERGYAYLHAYAAYRFGFRACPISEERTLENLLGRSGRLSPPQAPRLSIEDQFLGFPDRSPAHKVTRWSDLFERTRLLPALDHPEVLRVFVSAGQKNGTDDERRVRNRGFREYLAACGRLGTMVYKPRSGIFDLWEAAGLRRILNEGRQPGQAKGFWWPPRYGNAAESDLLHGHSAPGRLLEVAVRLVSRAEGFAGDTPSAMRAVQGAVLAIDAMELLGEKAPTTFLEALVLKHEFEARAECQSYGVQSHFDVGSRIREIHLEVEELGRYFHRSKSKEAQWEAEAAVLNGLIRVFREFNQFDEEQLIQATNRMLHRRLWFKSRMGILGDQMRWINPFYWLACYVHLLIKSMPLFIFAIVLWIGGLTASFTVASRSTEALLVSQGFEDAVSSFFSAGAPVHHDREKVATAAPGPQPVRKLDERVKQIEIEVRRISEKLDVPRNSATYVGVVCLAIVAGFVHVGVFISHLYSIASRK